MNRRERIESLLGRVITDDQELAAIRRGVPFLEAVSLDSLAMTYLVTEFEREFGVRFDPETLEDVFRDIHTLETFLHSRTGPDGT